MSSRLKIREGILEEYSELFGEKTINGKKIKVEDLIEELCAEFIEEINEAMRYRRKLLDAKIPFKDKYSFPSWDEKFKDAEGNERTFKEILQGMIDNFIGRESDLRWGLNENSPIPKDANPMINAGLEITGPWYPLSRAFNQINSDVASIMEDEEDASPAWFIPYGSESKFADVWESRRNVKRILEGRYPDPYIEKGKIYRIKNPRNKWPSIFHRIPGMHLLDFDFEFDGKPVPSIIVSLVIYILNNYESLKKAGSGVYLYVPKIQNPREALILEKMLRRIETKLGMNKGEIKLAILYEEGNAGRYLPVIFWILRERLIKSNNGRWDYLASLIEMWKDVAAFPDPQNITMTSDIMMTYQRYNALMILLAGSSKDGLKAFPVGGMAAVMLYPSTDPYGRNRYNAKALRSIKLDKLRERLIGLIFITEEKVDKRITLDEILKGKVKGKLYDLFRQSWVATKEESYVKEGNKPLRASLEEVQAMINSKIEYITIDGERIPTPESGLTEQDKKLFQRLGLIDAEGKITPWVITKEMVDTPEKLLNNKELWGGKDLWHALYDIPQGDITPEHIQHAFYMAANYGFQVLNGNLAAAIDDYELKQRFMNDLATYRIFVSWLWTLLYHRARITKQGYLKAPALTKDGVIPFIDSIKIKEGERFDELLFDELWKLHFEWTKEFYEEQDRRAAIKIIKEFNAEEKFFPIVKEILSKAYSEGPFRNISSKEAAERIAEIINAEKEGIEKVIIQEAPRFDRRFAGIIMEILREQLKSKFYIQHTARVLFVLASLDEEKIKRILKSIFKESLDEVIKKINENKYSKDFELIYRYIHDIRY